MKFVFKNENFKHSDLAQMGNVPVVFAGDKESEVVTFESGAKMIKIGVGTSEKNLSLEKLRLKVREVIILAQKRKIKKLAIDFMGIYDHMRYPSCVHETAELVGTNLVLANYEYRSFKKEPEDGWNDIEEVLIYNNVPIRYKECFDKGIAIAEEKNKARDLCNMPPEQLTPQGFENEVGKFISYPKICGEDKLNLHVIKGMDIRGMGGIWAVGKGSPHEPCFVVLEYNGGKEDEKPIVLIGKGITMDTGGINTKSSEYMEDMHLDMTGAAVVFRTVALAYRLGIKKNVVALLPLAENMPGPGSYTIENIIKIGDMSVRVTHTDAEGRLILADALNYACEHYDSEVIVTVATLTGAACVALGESMSAVITRDDELGELFCSLGEEKSEYMWPLPINDKFKEQMKDEKGTADLRNLSASKYGGASTAAAFLENFVGDNRWVHIDIAPRMKSQSGENLANGPVGEPLETLLAFLERVQG